MHDVRLIDATRLHAQVFNDNGGDLSKTENVAQILLRIENAPTIDAQPVKRGKWISEKVQKKDWKGIERSYFQPNSCSVCHIGVAVRTKFCPNCGSKMDGEKDETD